MEMQVKEQMHQPQPREGIEKQIIFFEINTE